MSLRYNVRHPWTDLTIDCTDGELQYSEFVLRDHGKHRLLSSMTVDKFGRKRITVTASSETVDIVLSSLTGVIRRNSWFYSDHTLQIMRTAMVMECREIIDHIDERNDWYATLDIFQALQLRDEFALTSIDAAFAMDDWTNIVRRAVASPLVTQNLCWTRWKFGNIIKIINRVTALTTTTAQDYTAICDALIANIISDRDGINANHVTKITGMLVHASLSAEFQMLRKTIAIWQLATRAPAPTGTTWARLYCTNKPSDVADYTVEVRGREASVTVNIPPRKRSRPNDA